MQQVQQQLQQQLQSIYNAITIHGALLDANELAQVLDGVVATVTITANSTNSSSSVPFVPSLLTTVAEFFQIPEILASAAFIPLFHCLLILRSTIQPNTNTYSTLSNSNSTLPGNYNHDAQKQDLIHLSIQQLHSALNFRSSLLAAPSVQLALRCGVTVDEIIDNLLLDDVVSLEQSLRHDSHSSPIPKDSARRLLSMFDAPIIQGIASQLEDWLPLIKRLLPQILAYRTQSSIPFPSSSMLFSSNKIDQLVVCLNGDELSYFDLLLDALGEYLLSIEENQLPGHLLRFRNDCLLLTCLVSPLFMSKFVEIHIANIQLIQLFSKEAKEAALTDLLLQSNSPPISFCQGLLEILERSFAHSSNRNLLKIIRSLHAMVTPKFGVSIRFDVLGDVSFPELSNLLNSPPTVENINKVAYIVKSLMAQSNKADCIATMFKTFLRNAHYIFYCLLLVAVPTLQNASNPSSNVQAPMSSSNIFLLISIYCSNDLSWNHWVENADKIEELITQCDAISIPDNSASPMSRTKILANGITSLRAGYIQYILAWLIPRLQEQGKKLSTSEFIDLCVVASPALNNNSGNAEYKIQLLWIILSCIDDFLNTIPEIEAPESGIQLNKASILSLSRACVMFGYLLVEFLPKVYAYGDKSVLNSIRENSNVQLNRLKEMKTRLMQVSNSKA